MKALVTVPTACAVLPAPTADAGAMHAAQRRNYRLLLYGGGGFIMALLSGNPNFVLPWLASHLGGPAFLVALIVPLLQIGSVASELTLGPQLRTWRRRKQMLVTAVLGLAVSMLLAALATVGPSPTFAVDAILMCALINGVFMGLNRVANQELIAKTMHETVRGKLLGQRVTLGGLLTIAVTLIYQALAPQDPHHSVIALWVAVMAWTASALVFSAVTEDVSTPEAPQRLMAALAQGLAALRHHFWFRRFMQSRFLFVTVELAMPFYAIHATTLHTPSAQNLSIFICALSLGLVLAGPLWGRWTYASCHLVAAAGAALAAASGVATLVVDGLGYLHLPYIHAVLIMLLALGRQGVLQARLYYLSVRAPAPERSLYISIGDGLVGIWGMLFVLPLGWAAHLYHVSLPLIALIVLQALTALYAARALRLAPPAAPPC